ncbi:MAG: hypothetical protein RR585_06775 [Coprobacillus sp.]
MNIEELFKKEIEYLERKFPKKEKDVLDEIENSINIYRSLRQDTTISIFDDYEKNWIKRCAIELLTRDIDKRNINSYSENGFSESYFTDVISKSLMNEIFPKAKSF